MTPLLGRISKAAFCCVYIQASKPATRSVGLFLHPGERASVMCNEINDPDFEKKGKRDIKTLKIK